MAITVSPGRVQPPARGDRLRSVARYLVTAVAVLGVAAVAVTIPITRRDEAARSTSPTALAGAREAVALAARTNEAEAYAAAERAVDQLGRGPREDVVRGVLALSLHDFPAAHRLGTRALDAAPGNPDALTVLVDASVELGRYDEARSWLEQLLDRRPGPSALARLSYFRELHGDVPGAIDAMVAAARGAENLADGATYLAFLGTLELTAGRLDDASASFEESIQARPDHLPALVGQAQVQAARGDLSGAIAALERLAERSPQPAVATLLGALQQRAGDDLAAARAFALVTADARILTAAGVQTDLDVAAFQARHGVPAEAVAVATAAYEDRRTVLTAATLGWALNRAGRPDDAVGYVEESLELGTRQPALRLHAAATFELLGRTGEAHEHLLVAFESTPWTDPSLVPLASELATRLDIALPASWRF